MNLVGVTIAWVVMVGGAVFFVLSGLLAMALLCRYVMDRMWAAIRAGVSMAHLRQAIREWHVNHPDLSNKWHKDDELGK